MLICKLDCLYSQSKLENKWNIDNSNQYTW